MFYVKTATHLEKVTPLKIETLSSLLRPYGAAWPEHKNGVQKILAIALSYITVNFKRISYLKIMLSFLKTLYCVCYKNWVVFFMEMQHKFFKKYTSLKFDLGISTTTLYAIFTTFVLNSFKAKVPVHWQGHI